MESLALTTTELRMWFKEFNAEYFDNKLSMPTLQIKKCKSYLGICYPSRKIITISNFYSRSRHDFRETLIHEMIHLYNYNYDSRYIGHGTPFKSKAREINYKGGWNISRCSNVPKEVKETATAINDKLAYAFVINDYQHYGKLHFSLVSYDAYRKGKYHHIIDYFNKKGWELSIFVTRTTHYPTARVCRSKVYGHYIRKEDIQRDIDCKKLARTEYNKAI